MNDSDLVDKSWSAPGLLRSSSVSSSLTTAAIGNLNVSFINKLNESFENPTSQNGKQLDKAPQVVGRAFRAERVNQYSSAVNLAKLIVARTFMQNAQPLVDCEGVANAVGAVLQTKKAVAIVN